MATAITPILPGLPPITSIQDPAARAFCQAVADVLRAMQSQEGAVQSVAKAFEAVGGVGQGATVADGAEGYGVPQFTISSILRSRLYGALNRVIPKIPAIAGAGTSSQIASLVTTDQAMYQTINDMWAAVGVNNALIQDGGVVQTNYSAAQALKWNTLQAEVFGTGGNTIRAALAEEAEVRADETGHLFGQYSVKVDLNGYVTGFGFSSTANNGPPESQFVVLANRFAVVTPGGTPIVPFVVEGTVTYINNAVIKKGNVFDLTVGNEIKSDNYIGGSSGWRITKAGNAEFRNILARGDVEASTLKAGTAMVGTLHIQGNAVTIPVHVESSGAYPGGGSAGGWLDALTGYVDPEGGAVSVIAYMNIQGTYDMLNSIWNYSSQIRILAPSGAVIGSMEVTGNGERGTATLVGKSTEAGTYRLQTFGSNADKRSMLLLGCKR